MKISNLIPMNLQLFSNSGGIESSVNAEPAANVEPQVSEPVTPESVPGEVATPQANRTVQSAEDNARFAAVRREAEARAREEAQRVIDAEYSRLYGEQYGIHSKADYDRAVKEAEEQQRLQAEAARMQASPELLKEIEELKAFKNETLAEKQKRENEEFQTKLKTDVQEVIKAAEKDGVKITEEQLLQTMIDEGIANPSKAYKLMKPEPNIEEIKQKAITEYVEKIKKGYKPVEGGGTAPVVVQEAPKTFDEARKRAIEIMKGSKEFN